MATQTKYRTITSEERAKIIQYFVEEGQTSSQIATITGHNLSTIKAIYRIFKKEGRMFKKEKRDRTFIAVRNYIVAVIGEEPKFFKVLSKQQEKSEFILRDNDTMPTSVDKISAIQLESSKQRVLNQIENPQAQYVYLKELQILTTNGVGEGDFTQITKKNSNNNQKISMEIKRQFQIKHEEEDSPNKQVCVDQKLISLKQIFESQLDLIYGRNKLKSD